MVWAADLKANRLPITAPHRYAQYFPSAIAAQTVAANTSVVLTLTAAFGFKMNGQVEATLPHGATLVAGLVLGQTQLIAPASGSYAAGNHPIITVQVTNPTAAALTPAATDLVIVQY